MFYRSKIAIALLSMVCASPAWNQNPSGSEGCDMVSPGTENAPQTRTRVTWIQRANGKQTAVLSPVKGMKVARLMFVGNPALPLPVQEQIANSLVEHDYDDDQESLD